MTPPPDTDEEAARAEVYALLAALLAAPPSVELYRRLRAAPVDAPVGPVAEGFATLVAASRRLERDAVRDEYDALFQGIAKAEVMLHSSYYLAGALNDAPLVALRDELRAIGLERDAAQGVTEDHVACLCEVMQHLIANADLAAQRRFFDAHIAAWNGALWDALTAHPRSDFYRAVAGLARDFLGVEAQAFDMLES